MPLVSVIVIAYRVGRFLRECIESITAQTYKDLEIICVVGNDDEECLEILSELSERDGRLKVISEEPRGTAVARNRGLDEAAGDYIAFVDGDDKIAPDTIERMVISAKHYNAEISVIGRYDLYENKTEPSQEEDKKTDTVLLGAFGALEVILYQTGFFLHIWDKLYRRDLFENIRFDPGKKVEDRYITYRLICSAEAICYNKRPGYFFRVSSDSGSRVEDNLRKSFEADKQICKEIMDIYPGLLSACEYFMTYEAMSVIQNDMLCNSFSKEKDREYLGYVRAFSSSVYKNKNVGRGVKLKTFLCLHFPGILKRLTISRRNKFLKTHIPFTTGTDWGKIYEKQKVE